MGLGSGIPDPGSGAKKAPDPGSGSAILATKLLEISYVLYVFSTASSVPTDAGIEPRTVATCALAVRHSNH
jgi:hypothetical protein